MQTEKELKDIIFETAHDLPNVNVELLFQHIDKLMLLKSKSDLFKDLSLLCSNKNILHYEWGVMAGRFELKRIKLTSAATFSEATERIKNTLNPEYYNFVINNREVLDAMIDEESDNRFNIASLGMLSNSYLASIKRDGKKTIVETPQFMWLRVATFLWFPNLERIKKTYDSLRVGDYIHASPTLFHSGFRKHQLASCFVMSIGDNSNSIFSSWANTGFISANSGGIGIDYASVRHSEIGEQGQSNGVMPWIKIHEQILKGVDQGGKRLGSGAFYLPDWHVDFEDFLEMRLVDAPEHRRALSAFQGIWGSDLFYERVKNNEEWMLVCPNKAKGLADSWGAEFDRLYLKYEGMAKAGKIVPPACKFIPAQDIMRKYISILIKSGMPYSCCRDAFNRKSNQSNLGNPAIRLSNLCSEMGLHTDEENIGSCILANACLNSCVMEGDPQTGADVFMSPSKNRKVYFDFDKLGRIVRDLVQNLNQVIDRNFYIDEVPQIKYANFRNRPLGMGQQALANVFAKMDLCWEDEEAYTLNAMIAETMYYYSALESMELAKIHGPYETFRVDTDPLGKIKEDSWMSKGYFQFDLWDREAILKGYKSDNYPEISLDYLRSKCKGPYTGRYDWDSLRRDVMQYGVYNSLFIALMPTASSSGICPTNPKGGNNNESFEPFTQHIFTRNLLSGKFIFVNAHVMDDLKEIGLWNGQTLKSIIANKGSIQNLEIDENMDSATKDRLIFLKRKYKTAYELPQKLLVDMALERGRYVCHSQSFNCFMSNPDPNDVYNMIMYSWERGAKTIIYYLKQTASVDPINFSLDTLEIDTTEGNGMDVEKDKKSDTSKEMAGLITVRKKKGNFVCTDEVCVMCQ